MSDNAYVSQVTTEVLVKDDPNVRLSQSSLAVLYRSVDHVKISQVALLVLRAAGTGPTVITITENINQEIDASQTVITRSVFSRFVSSSATAGQTIVIPPHIFIVSVSNRVSVDQLAFVNSPRILDVASLGAAGQFIIGKNATTYVVVASLANIKQTILGRNSTHTVIVSQTASVHGSFVLRGLTFVVTAGNTASVAHKFNNEYAITVNSTASVAQYFAKTKYVTVTMADHLTPSETYTYSRELERNFSDLLTLEESYSTLGLIFNRTLSDILLPGDNVNNVRDNYKAVIIVATPEAHPRVTGVDQINPKHTVVSGAAGEITLPAAEIGDSYAAKVQTTIKRSMTGKTYTYVRTNDEDVFTLTWKLSLIQAYDLRNILVSSFNQYVGIRMWNGQVWHGRVISTNLPLTHDARWQGNDQEQLTLIVQFEGYRSL